MSEIEKSTFPLRLTQAQRCSIAELLAHLKPQLLLDCGNQRTLQFALEEIKEIAGACQAAIPKAPTGMERNSLRHVIDATEQALEMFSEGNIHRIPAGERLYQFKIYGIVHGDPDLLCEGWQDESSPVNSLETKVSTIVPEDGTQIRFEYEYDFGDGWEHEVLFEGCLHARNGGRYPVCVEGERACPPEDVLDVGTLVTESYDPFVRSTSRSRTSLPCLRNLSQNF